MYSIFLDNKKETTTDALHTSCIVASDNVVKLSNRLTFLIMINAKLTNILLIIININSTNGLT